MVSLPTVLSLSTKELNNNHFFACKFMKSSSLILPFITLILITLLPISGFKFSLTISLDSHVVFVEEIEM